MRLLKIELQKLWPNRAFKWMSTLYLIAMVIIAVGVMPFLKYLKSRIEDFDIDGVDPTIVPFYEFPDIWQNLTSVVIWFKLLLAFSLIFSITNEFTYRTIRQNIIDGLSKYEFVWSKIILVGFLALVSTVMLFVLGLFTGLIYSSEISLALIFEDSYFLLAFFLQLFVFLIFTLFVAILIRKAIITMFLMVFWILAVENGLFIWGQVKDQQWVEYLLPVKSINSLIHNPFPKYFFMEIQDFITLPELALVCGWGALFYWATTRLIVKRDL
jgi:hypothetical protein